MANVAIQNLFTLFQAVRHAEIAARAALKRARALRPGDANLAANLGACWLRAHGGSRGVRR